STWSSKEPKARRRRWYFPGPALTSKGKETSGICSAKSTMETPPPSASGGKPTKARRSSNRSSGPGVFPPGRFWTSLSSAIACSRVPHSNPGGVIRRARARSGEESNGATCRTLRRGAPTLPRAPKSPSFLPFRRRGGRAGSGRPPGSPFGTRGFAPTRGRAQTALPVLSPGDLVLEQRFRLLRPLARGGMGEVFLAEQVSLGRTVALKVLRRDLREQPGMNERFQREATLLAQVDHPAVVGIIEYGLHEGASVLVMEYVEGRTLEAALEKGDLTPQQAYRILMQVVDGLSAIHAAGIVHRDL